MLSTSPAKLAARFAAALASTALAFGASVAPVHAQSEGEDASAIVEQADHIRFPPQAFEAAVKIDTVNGDEAPVTRKYRVLSKGTENTIVMITEPASERGQIMLMKGHDLWVFLPNVSQPVRLSLSQRLTGQVANGDLARANFAGDYDAKVLRSEELEGEPTLVLELTAKDRGVTYSRVLYWVKKSNHAPVKAEFYAVSGRLLKTCTYEGFRRVAGRSRPTRLVMQDALRPDERSVLEYTDIRLRDLPDRMFTKDYLKRLE